MGANGAGKTTLVPAMRDSSAQGRRGVLRRRASAAQGTPACVLACHAGCEPSAVQRQRARRMRAGGGLAVRGECELAADSPRDADGASGLGSPAARIDEVLAALDLAHLEERHPMALSGGQKTAAGHRVRAAGGTRGAAAGRADERA
ncbi:hypothetical protein [Eggerthella sinensis]|uniref:hypothetical protein n=1 Tax=Eggerthella sinensis TaxID=242230 RepID=UPI003A4D6423